MTNSIQKHIAKMVDGENLTAEEAEFAFQIIMNGGATPAHMAAFLTALRMKGETVAEITAGAKVMRSKATPFKAPENAVDTCGTGGDAKGTVNVSTAVAIVVAACGVPVAKHGNRSVSSKSGSSDVLTELGVDVNASVEVMEEAIAAENCRLAFLMAPRFHSAMRHVAPVRQELGLRTIFNLLGPLSNPAKPKFQVVGVYDKKWLEPLAEVLGELGAERAWVVHGADGLDELSTTGESFIAELNNGSVKSFSVTPEEVGLPRAELKDLIGADAKRNADAMMTMLGGAKNAYRDIVLFNAAAVLVVAGAAEDLKAGITQAAEAIDSGKAKQTLAHLVSYSNDAEMIRKTLGQNP